MACLSDYMEGEKDKRDIKPKPDGEIGSMSERRAKEV